MGNAHDSHATYGATYKHDDPRYVLVPANYSGYTRVVISVPDEVEINDVLLDLVEEGFIPDLDEPDKHSNHYVIKRSTEASAQNLLQYINNKWGMIADVGYVKSASNVIQGVDTSPNKLGSNAHVAVVREAAAKNPNEQFEAYERAPEAESGLPQFRRIDIEEKIHYVRPENVKQALKYQWKLRQQQSSSPQQKMRVRRNQFGQQQAQFNGTVDAMEKENQMEQDQRQRAAFSLLNGSAVDNNVLIQGKEAIRLDYTEKSRRLRRQLEVALSKSQISRKKMDLKIRHQFKYDFWQDMIAKKKRKWMIDRTKRIYKNQQAKRHLVTKIRQEVNPTSRVQLNLMQQMQEFNM